MKLDAIDTRKIDYAVGVLRGVLSSDLRMQLDDELRANLEDCIEHVRAAARTVERMRAHRERAREALLEATRAARRMRDSARRRRKRVA